MVVTEHMGVMDIVIQAIHVMQFLEYAVVTKNCQIFFNDLKNENYLSYKNYIFYV